MNLIRHFAHDLCVKNWFLARRLYDQLFFTPFSRVYLGAHFVQARA